MGRHKKVEAPEPQKKEARLHLLPGEKVKLAKGDESPHYDRTEAVPGVQVGKSPKFV